ncbi:MAG TPA: metalloregulator ArsR/SmtB family transcription factor [Candidatus Saccharimonadales bacterium]|jgi:predicted transcriptional regulator
MTTSVKSTNLQAMFNALGDSTRYKIVKLLKSKPELCVSEVADTIGISTAGVSQHMKVLEQSGLVRPQRMGQKTCYRLQADDDSNKTLLKLIK